MSGEKSQAQVSWKQRAKFLLFGCFLFAAWMFAALCQFVVPGYIPFYTYVLYALWYSMLGVPWARSGDFQDTKFRSYQLSLVAIAFLWLFPLSSRQPFLNDLYSVQPGMTVAQVNDIMGQYMKGTGWPANPFSSSDDSTNSLTEIGSNSTYQTRNNDKGELEIDDALVYRHSDDAAYNADWGVIRFRHGRVVTVEFMPD